MTVEESKQYYRDQIVWKSYNPGCGGQHVLRMVTPITLVCDELSFSIEISHFRSSIKNRELALTLFELFLDEVVK